MFVYKRYLFLAGTIILIIGIGYFSSLMEEHLGFEKGSLSGMIIGVSLLLAIISVIVLGYFDKLPKNVDPKDMDDFGAGPSV